jgi:hypothetical protein
MISSLAGPELLSLLVSSFNDSNNSKHPATYSSVTGCSYNEHKEETTHPRMVLIIEDADSCLSSRASDNISAISNILNMSEGLIGNLLDLRIVCTTNSSIDEVDEAVKRKGRLSARIEVGLLDKEQAEVVYKRLGGKEGAIFDQKYYSLASVYSMANQETEQVELTGKKKNKVGFCV